MERTNKVMLIAAVGAVAILIASSVVRCAVSSGPDGDAPEPAPAAEQAALDTAAGQEDEERGDAGALATLKSHAWQAEGNPSLTVVFKDGMFVESDGLNVKLTALDVTSETDDSLDAKMTRDGNPAEVSSTISISGSEGSYKVSCDAFQNAKTYVQGTASKDPVAVEGVTEPYTSLIDGRTDQLASSVAEYCRSHVPTATKAVFDGEVYLDVKDGSVSATYHCDDAAATILQVTYKDGAFTVAG